MSLIRFVSKDGREFLVFDNELDRLPDGDWKEQPPDPRVIQSTFVYMLEFPQLDSIISQYELDNLLNIEAAQERETREFQQALIQ